MQPQIRHFDYIKNIVFLTIFVLIMMWMLKPYLKNNNYIFPEKYYELGLTCLTDFENTTRKYNHELTNTYAKKVSISKDMILIRAQNQLNHEQLQIECIYDTGKLLYVSLNDQRLELH